MWDEGRMINKLLVATPRNNYIMLKVYTYAFFKDSFGLRWNSAVKLLRMAILFQVISFALAMLRLAPFRFFSFRIKHARLNAG